MRLKKVTIKNIRTFKEETFDLENRGLVSIIGMNGSGKTTLFNAVRANLFNAMNDKSKFDDLVRNKKDAQIVVEFENNGKEYISDLSRIKGKWIYEILENGVNITPHNQIDARKIPAIAIGVTAEEWDAAIQLSQKGAHVLVSGTPAKRKEYISEFFGIDDKYDVIQERAKEELKKVENSIREIESYSHTKQALEEELKQIHIVDVKAEEDRIHELSLKIQDSKDKVSLLKDVLSKQKLWELYSADAYPAGYEQVDAAAWLRHFQDEKLSLESRVNNYKKASEYNLRVEASNRQYEELNKWLDSQSLLASRYPESSGVYVNERATLRAKKQTSLSRVTYLNQLKDLRHLEGNVLHETTGDEQLLSEMRSEYAVSSAKYTATMNGKCPTCGSEFSHEHVLGDYQKLVDLGNKIAELDQKIVALKNENVLIMKFRDIEKQLSGIPEFTDNEDLHLASLEQDIDKVIDYQNKKKIFEGLAKSEPMDLGSLPTEQETEQNKVNLNFYQKMVNARALCPTSIPSSSESSLLETEIARLTREIVPLEEDLLTLRSSVMAVEKMKQSKKRIEDQIETINEKFLTLGRLHEEELYWKTMVFAYGPKGLRVVQLQKIMDLILSVLPAYTARMFNGKRISFTTEVDAGSISIIATREDEEGVYTNDISTLSGGEASKMTVCLIFAVAKARLAKKKSNVIILDEVDAQVDEEGKFLFVNELLPMMRDEFESVFVISHSKDTSQTAIFDENLLFKKPENLHYTEIHNLGKSIM
jgi:DNA repair exonuclease SbcCD ATPase subunit